ncbi:molluscan insulin-related peptide 3-like [Haliotis rubra]|uniref:molluscan insulin-related peptide 3-like n=1 Tax=Haliotis rubra TaxID=36100 RepID=UPI001EE5F51A|nr:molluscan insulin-related peptide 3-like [Haliotis rubra]
MLRVHLWSICLLLGLMFGARPVYAGTTRTCFLQDRTPHPRGICDNVPETMRRICRLFPRNARSVDVDSGQELVKYRTSKKSALSYLSKRTGSQGFICECCWNQCSPRELVEYCGQ